MSVCAAGGTRGVQVRSQSGGQRGQSGRHQGHSAPYGPRPQESISVSARTHTHTHFLKSDLTSVDFLFASSISAAAAGVISHSAHTSTTAHKPVKRKEKINLAEPRRKCRHRSGVSASPADCSPVRRPVAGKSLLLTSAPLCYIVGIIWNHIQLFTKKPVETTFRFFRCLSHFKVLLRKKINTCLHQISLLIGSIVPCMISTNH